LREIKIRGNTGGGFENLSHRIFNAYAALSHRNSETTKPLSEALEDSSHRTTEKSAKPLSEALEDSGKKARLEFKG
jgi:hypothetical protein